MNFCWIAASDSPRLEWGYNGEGAQEAHEEALRRRDINNRAVLLRGVFFAEKSIKKATALICGLGLYRFRINGARVSDAAYAPLETNFRKRVLYDEFDVTKMLSAGENVFAIELGCGRYSSAKKYWGWRSRWHGDPLAALDVQIEYEDGTCGTFATGKEWKTAPSPVVRDCIFDGEIYDARLEIPGWTRPGFDVGAWDNALCVAAPSERISKNEFFAVKKRRHLAPKNVKEPVNGVVVVDFGENIAGWVKIRVSGERGARVTIRYAEQLADTVDTRSMRYAQNTDIYILRGDGEEEYEPGFTLHGFSCVEITAEDCRARLIEVQACEVCADCAGTGEFWCDNEDINRLHGVILRTQRAALQSYPIDCPQRDERLGWLGDAHVTDLTCMYNMDMRGFYEKWLGDVHLDCHSETGEVPQIAPRVDFEHAVDWSGGYAIILWDCYLFYRDEELLRKYTPDIMRYVDTLAQRGPILEMSRYGDWLSPAECWRRGEPECCTTLYYYYNILLLVKMLKTLGRDSEKYETLAREVRGAMLARFYDAQTKLFGGGSQFAQSLALKLGIIPEDDTAAAVGGLCADIEKNGHLTTGILGTKYVAEMLAKYGRGELLMWLILRRGYPGWLDLIEGKTTLSESWDGSGSQNHCMFGSIDAAFYSLLGGINVGDEVTVKPYFAAEINHVKCRTRVRGGEIFVEWQRTDEGVRLQLSSEEKVRLILPDGRELFEKECRITVK